MFLAKYLDQRQGESRVVDQQQLVRERLEGFLQARPSAVELVERGVLGGRERFELASTVVDGLLRARLLKAEAEHSQLPAGSYIYPASANRLLSQAELPSAEELERQLKQLQAEHSRLQVSVPNAREAWQSTARVCETCASGPSLPQALAEARSLLDALEEQRQWTGGSLAGVFEELRAFKRLVSKKYGLQNILSVMEKTDAVREAAFSWKGVDALPLAVMEELPGLCASLPPHSRAVGLGRLQFVLGPIRVALLQALKEELRATRRWPLDSSTTAVSAPTAPATPAAEAAKASALKLCCDLQRLQSVERQVKKGLQEPGRALGEAREESDTEACGAGNALARPLLERFRHHFCRPESELCRMDRPEWAFRYLLELCTEHDTEIKRWMAELEGEAGRQRWVALDALELSSGLSTSVALEARLFVRARMPTLVSSESHSILLQTIHHFVRFCSDISSIGGNQAVMVAFADFDQNRCVFPPKGNRTPPSSAPLDSAQAAETPGVDSGKEERGRAVGSVRARLLAGISHLRPLEGAAGQPAPEVSSDGEADWEAPRAASDVGFLDAWAAADATVVAERLAAAERSGGCAWRPRELAARQGQVQGEGQGRPAAGELAALVVELFSGAHERARYLVREQSRATYAKKALAAGLLQAVASVRTRWDRISKPLQEVSEASLVLETLEELCQFLDTFPLALHIVAEVDDANALRVSLIERLVAAAVLESSRRAWQSLCSEMGLFTFTLAPCIAAYRERLRPSLFLTVARQLASKLAEQLVDQLLRQSPFSTCDEMAVFVSNCQEDLQSLFSGVLEASDLEPLEPLWAGCRLLRLPLSEARPLLSLLSRHWSARRGSPGFGTALAAASVPASQIPGTSELQEALETAGARALRPADAMSVLARRPDLCGAAERESLGLQDALLPLATAQATLQLGSDALQQLGTHGAETFQGLGLSAAFPNAVGVEDLRGLAGGAGRLFAGKLRSTLRGIHAA